MADNSEANKNNAALLNAYVGTVDAASIEEKTGKNDKPYVTAKMDVPGRENPVELYVHGEKNIATLRDKAGGEPFFVQGEMLARGKALGVSTFEPKAYTATIDTLHKSGTNEYGDWAAAKVKIEGMDKPKQVMFSGEDAKAAVEAGKGGQIEFKGAWKPEQNDESKNWYSRLVSASSLERTKQPEAEDTPAP